MTGACLIYIGDPYRTASRLAFPGLGTMKHLTVRLQKYCKGEVAEKLHDRRWLPEKDAGDHNHLFQTYRMFQITQHRRAWVKTGNSEQESQADWAV